MINAATLDDATLFIQFEKQLFFCPAVYQIFFTLTPNILGKFTLI